MPLMLNSENFEYWKDKIQSFFMFHNSELWDMIEDGYVAQTDEKSVFMHKRKHGE